MLGPSLRIRKKLEYPHPWGLNQPENKKKVSEIIGNNRLITLPVAAAVFIFQTAITAG